MKENEKIEVIVRKESEIKRYWCWDVVNPESADTSADFLDFWDELDESIRSIAKFEELQEEKKSADIATLLYESDQERIRFFVATGIKLNEISKGTAGLSKKDCLEFIDTARKLAEMLNEKASLVESAITD